MFTGIVETIGIVDQVQGGPNGTLRVRVRIPDVASHCPPASSVAVNGVCLTVAQQSHQHLEFDVVRETLDRTTLGSIRAGSRVNIERSLRVGDRIDGHFVQGHVDGQATVSRIIATGVEHVVWFKAQPSLLPFLIPKGSVTIDGVSLTIAAIASDEFSVALIPTTLKITTLGALKSGDHVNLETDIITRTIVHHLLNVQPTAGNGVGQHAEPLTLQRLKEAGFA